MPVANPEKTVNVKSMPSGGTATVSISFRSAAGLALKPADIVLIMDCSSGMSGEKMAFAKSAAKQFVDLLEGARDGATRMGLVSFGSEAKEELPLGSDFSLLKPAIEALSSGGTKNHKAAFEAAGKILSVPSSQRQLVVMFTEGESSSGASADPAVQALKDKGVEVFCIGLAADTAALNRWASEPDRIHGAYTDDASQLERLFMEIGAEVILAGARDVLIEEQLTADFKILKIHRPGSGSVRLDGPRKLSWAIDAAGLKEQPDKISLSFDIMHIGNKMGVLAVNESLIYSDREGNTLNFPSPHIEVYSSGAELYPEPCPEPTVLEVPSCKDAVHVTLKDTALLSLGRIVQLDLTIKSVCPGKRVAASIILNELGPEGELLPRAVKHILLPAQSGHECQDIKLKCIRFSLPEALDASGNASAICNSRAFEAQVIANYVDTDFICCDEGSALL